MTKTQTVTIQRFEIYGKRVSMGLTATIKLKKIGNKKYLCQDDFTWIRTGATYIRPGNEHGFMIID